MPDDLEQIMKSFVSSQTRITELFKNIKGAKSFPEDNSFWLQSTRNLSVLYALLSAEFSGSKLSISGIARQIGTTRPNISRILKDARGLQLIDEFNSPTESSRKLVQSSIEILLSDTTFLSYIKEFVFRTSLLKTEETSLSTQLDNPSNSNSTSNSVVQPRGVDEVDDATTIAVLPFSDLSEGQDQGVFIDGLCEAIISELSRFNDLDVISRNSSLLYKDQTVDIRQVGQELGANYILEGSIRRDKNFLRIQGRLLDTIDGSNLWSQHFDHLTSEKSSFQIQDEVALGMASAIGDLYGVLGHLWQGLALRTAPGQLSADRSVALVNAYFTTGSEKEHNLARDVIETARERAPNNSDVLAQTANIYMAEHWLSHNSLPNSLNRSLDAASRAVELDPTSDRAYSALANVHFHRGENTAFKAAADRVLQLAPTSNFRLAQIGNAYYFSGGHSRGLRLLNGIDESINNGHSAPIFGLFRLPFFCEAFKKDDYEEALRVINMMAMPSFWGTQALSLAAANALDSPNEIELAKFRLKEVWPEFRQNGKDALLRLIKDLKLANQIISSIYQTGI